MPTVIREWRLGSLSARKFSNLPKKFTAFVKLAFLGTVSAKQTVLKGFSGGS
jgi:hypothetical protein